jgi:geranylgeranyl diphosphate synthase type II
VYGEQEKFGKVSGGDIIAGKKTFLYLKALESAGPQSLSFSKLYTSRETSSNDKVKKVKDVFDQLNIEKHTRDLIDDYYQKALLDLASISLPVEATDSLREYTESLMEREK